jgi:hypothetical protein
MHRREIGIFVATTVAFILTGCHAEVTAFRTTVRDNGEEHELVLRDETRRPQEEQAVVSGSVDDPLRFRINEVPEALSDDPVVLLELELSGDYRGGQIEITDPVGYTGSFSDAVEYGAGIAPAESVFDGARGIVRLDVARFPDTLTPEALLDSELVFRASRGRSFTIEAVRFVTDLPDALVRFPGSLRESIFDQRVPVSVEPGTWRFTDLSHILSSGMDGVRLRYRMPGESFHDRETRPTVILEVSGEAGERTAFDLYLRPGTREIILRPDVWGFPARALTISDAPDEFDLHELSGTAMPDDSAIPVPIELSELLRYPADQWRRDDFEFFAWTLYPDILWFDTRDYAIQARLFRRLAFFVEKRGFVGSLLTDEELEERHGWNAHNYRPVGLADFFNAVRSTDFPLNEYEHQLRRIVLDQGVIVQDDDGRYLPGRGGVLSVSQASGPELRRLLITHEAMHGIFYEEPSFRRDAFEYWDNVLDARERGFWRDFFSWMSYSPDDRYLMVNEFQGYLLQQSERSVRWYFRSRTVDRLKAAYPQRVEQIDIFLRDYPSTFVEAGATMNEALYRAAGMVGGDPYDLRLLPE